MPPHLTMKPERLWQLDPESRFPDELEIFVPQDRDFKGYIRIKKGTQVDKDKLKVKVKCDHRSKFSNLSNWREEA